MLSTLPHLEILQQAAGATPAGSPDPFSVLQLGKALFTLSFLTLLTATLVGRAVWRIKGAASGQGAPKRSVVDVCLFWGAFTFGAGLFHTFMSLIVTSHRCRCRPRSEWTSSGWWRAPSCSR